MTLIGITVKNQPTAGVMYQPFVKSGVTISGIVGAGVWGLTQAAPHDGFVAATTSSHSSAKLENALQKVKADKIMRVGGAGYKGKHIILFTILFLLFYLFIIYYFILYFIFYILYIIYYILYFIYYILYIIYYILYIIYYILYITYYIIY
jgi:Inositol monophosphatase family